MGAKRSLVLDVISIANCNICNQRMVVNIVALNANHCKIKKIHVEFFGFMIKVFWTLWITSKRG
jgi:hypothetical protein